LTDLATKQAVERPTLRERLEEAIKVYGKLAFIIYLSSFALVFAGAALALEAGLDLSGAKREAGILAGAWLVTKITQPFRIAATLGITPLAARALRRREQRPDVTPDR
jgi:hypothetical protein